MLISNPELFWLRPWQSDSLTTRLYLIHTLSARYHPMQCTPPQEYHLHTSSFRQVNYTISHHLSSDHLHCKKNLQNSCIFFTKTFRKGKTPMLTRDFLVPSREGIFFFWGGNSIPLSAGVIFFSLLNVIFPYFPYFPIKFTGKLMEDSWLATGAQGRVVIKFGRWEKNSAPFVKLQVWKSVKILVNQSYYYRENDRDKIVDELGPFLALSGNIWPKFRPITFHGSFWVMRPIFRPAGKTAVLSL